MSSALCAETTAIEVQGVGASDPGKTPVIPASLARFKGVLLKSTACGTFADLGCKTLKLAAGTKDNAMIGGYEVEVALVSVAGGKAKTNITLKQGGKAIGTPLNRALSQGEPITVEAGTPKTPTILILTLKTTE
jgi:hypothetical protein